MTPAPSGVKSGAQDGKIGPVRGNGSRLQRSIFPESAPVESLYTREDWIDFRDPARISARAGASRELLPRVVVKELADNALDASGEVEFGIVDAVDVEAVLQAIITGDRDDCFCFFVSDDSPGMPGTDAEIAARFSIGRPMESSKTRRMLNRGMLGNGTRVVAGVVLISGGWLKVFTSGRCLTLEPREDGSTAIVRTAPWKGTGTRIEVTLGSGAGMSEAAASDEGIFDWAEEAQALAGGTGYKGESSPWWYSDGAFWELLQAAGQTFLAREVGQLAGCTARPKVADIVRDWAKRPCASLTREEAATVLSRAREQAVPVKPERLGKVGRREDFGGYAAETGEFDADGATIPFVVEAWANRSDEAGITICVNRTPVLGQSSIWRSPRDSVYVLDGCGFDRIGVEAPARRAGDFVVTLNIITPFVPLMSSGKDPDLSPMEDEIAAAIKTAIRRAQSNCPAASAGGPSQKDLIESLIPASSEKLSGTWEHLFSLRQLFYDMRPALIKLLGREPSYGTFSKIVGEFEDRNGDVKCLYRDDRGTLIHPHTGEEISLGTRAVAEYSRPLWGFNKVLYAEKEGLFPALRQARWPERFDCALLSSKGYATRAVLALLKLLVDAGQPITFYLIHDADGPGTVIYESLARQLKRHDIEMVNLGLDPTEARTMGLLSEPVERKKGRVPVGSYVPGPDKKWIQTNRIELNAMSTPQFLEWLTAKITNHDSAKVVPPADVIRERLFAEASDAARQHITEAVLKAANIPDRVNDVLRGLNDELTAEASALTHELPATLKRDPLQHWTSVVRAIATRVTE